MALIALDARAAFADMPHGSGIYVRRLLEALVAGAAGDHRLVALRAAGSGPEVAWEQLRLPVLLRAHRAALVHSPDTFLPLRRPCPGVVTIHDLAFEAIPGDMRPSTAVKYRVLARLAARSAQRVICPSRFTAEDLARRWGVDEQKIRVIPEAPALPGVIPEAPALPGVIPEAPALPGEGPQSCAPADVAGLAPPGVAEPYLLSAGDLRPKKNLPLLIEAWLALRREGLPHRLVLAGADFGLAPALRSLAGAAPLELTGFVDDATLDALIRGAEVVVVPGYYEGFGLIALDAMARARPTVLARAGALPQTGGEAALYFEPHDARSLAQAIRAALSDGERLAAAGLRRAATFSWRQTAELTAAVYEELL